jgi:hypothetical protein
MRARQCCRDIQADAVAPWCRAVDQKIHKALNIDKSLLWAQLADEFDAVNDVAMHESVADEIEEGVENEEDARIAELERLLTVGQGMSAEEL